MRKFFVIILWFVPSLFGAFELQQLNTEIMATAGIVSFHPFGNNPAIFPRGQKFSMATNYTNLFGIKDLHCWDFGMRYKVKKFGSALVKANSVGNKIYQENTYTIGYACKLRIPMSVGISLSWYNLAVDKFQPENAFGITTGIFYNLTENLEAATLFGNVNRPKICDNNEMLPEYFAFGINWRILPQIEVKSEIFKDTLYPFNFRIASQITVIRHINLLTGFQTNPDRFTGGIAINISKIQFITSLQTHMKLPNTYYCGCSFIVK